MPQNKSRPNKPRQNRAKSRASRHRANASASAPEVLLFGLHAVAAALGNPNRRITRLWLTKNAAHRLNAVLQAVNIEPQIVVPAQLDKMLGKDTVHQGAALSALPLPELTLDDLKAKTLILLLDQVTDPHNVGAVLRSAAAFGAGALVMTRRHSPPLAGTLAKSASGALDLVPIVLVGNLADALIKLGEWGFLRLGLDGAATDVIARLPDQQPAALVLGAEGKGLRQRTKSCCDRLVRIPISPNVESLNVSNAAAIALYALSTSA